MAINQIGYWLSLVGAARAFFLTLILPRKLIGLVFFAPKSPSHHHSCNQAVQAET